MWYGQVEGTGIEVLDPRFKACFAGHVRVERLWTGARWSEGPAWFAAGRYLVWSDIPNDVQLRWLEDDGHVSVIRHPTGNSNGNTFDREGRQIPVEADELQLRQHPDQSSGQSGRPTVRSIAAKQALELPAGRPLPGFEGPVEGDERSTESVLQLMHLHSKA